MRLHCVDVYCYYLYIIARLILTGYIVYVKQCWLAGKQHKSDYLHYTDTEFLVFVRFFYGNDLKKGYLYLPKYLFN